MRGMNEEHTEASASEGMRCATSLCAGIPPWVASPRIAAVLEPYSKPGPMVNTPQPIPPKIRDLGDHLRLITHWTENHRRCLGTFSHHRQVGASLVGISGLPFARHLDTERAGCQAIAGIRCQTACCGQELFPSDRCPLRHHFRAHGSL